MRAILSKRRNGWLAILAVLLLSACATGQRAAGPAREAAPPPEAEPAPAETARGVDPAGPVTLALLVPRSSADEGAARLGAALVNAARLAEGELPGTGPPSISVYDTQGTPDAASAAARRAIDDGADLILGPLFSVSTDAVRPVAAEAGIKVLSFSNDAAVAGGPVFVTGYSPEAEVRRILSYAASQGRTDLAVFYPDTVYGQAAIRGAEAAAAASPLRIVVRTPYERSFRGIETASARFADAVRASTADAILLPAGGDELTAVGSFMNFHEVDPRERRYLGTQKWKARATFAEPALSGGWFPAPEPAREQGFAERYAARFGEAPPPLAYLGYDAVKIAGKLLAEARAQRLEDAFDPRAIMRPTGFLGATGPLRFTSDQVAERAMAILEVGPGRFEVRDPAPLSFAAGS